MPRGGQGGPRRFDQSFWIHPLPPNGPVTFIAQWRDVGLDEQQHEIDADAILTAAASSTPVWPRETTPAEEPAPDDLEAALLSALTHQLAGLEGVRIRGVLFDGHHPNTTVLITCDKLSPQPVSQEVRVSLWGDDKEASLAKRSPMEVGAAIVARLRDAVA